MLSFNLRRAGTGVGERLDASCWHGRWLAGAGLAAIVSLAAHFAVGAAKTMITVRSWWSSGLEMTLVGALEGIVTFVIGLGLGRMGA